jgi:hypothetical protein
MVASGTHLQFVRSVRWVLVVIGLVGMGCRAERAAEAPNPGNQAPDFQSAFDYDVGLREGAIVVRFEVADGFHVYTVGETVGKPLELELDERSDAALSGPVSYPKGITKDLSIGRSVIVEGHGEVRAPIHVPRATEAGRVMKATGRFRYQVCTEESCDRPRSSSFELPVSSEAS